MIRRLAAIAAAAAVAFAMLLPSDVGAASPPSIFPKVIKPASEPACNLAAGAIQGEGSASGTHYFSLVGFKVQTISYGHGDPSLIFWPSNSNERNGVTGTLGTGWCQPAHEGIAYGGQLDIVTLSDGNFPGPYGKLVSLGTGQAQLEDCTVGDFNDGWNQTWATESGNTFWYSLYGIDGSTQTPKCLPFQTPYSIYVAGHSGCSWLIYPFQCPDSSTLNCQRGTYQGHPPATGPQPGNGDVYWFGIENDAAYGIQFAVEDMCTQVGYIYDPPAPLNDLQTSLKYVYYQTKVFDSQTILGPGLPCGASNDCSSGLGGSTYGPAGQMHDLGHEQNNESSLANWTTTTHPTYESAGTLPSTTGTFTGTWPDGSLIYTPWGHN